MVPALDMIFGTYYLPKHMPAEYGVQDPIAADMAGQLIGPFAPKSSPAPLPR
jgi:sterol desaturase/sphingolipid hydroxylase (fatty acid hydroxylase superfamily)